jgi:dolichol-phosphate mannosyltransferase
VSAPKTLVIVPTYNEVESAPILISRILELMPDVHLLVVDDGSPDGTADVVEGIAQGDLAMRLFVMRRKEKSGLGAAYLAGFTWGIERGYTALIQMDADGSHRPEDLVELVKASHANPTLDLVIGSRWVKGGAVKNWNKGRELLSRVANKYAKLMLGIGVNDVTAGLRVYTAAILEEIDFSTVRSQGYCFQIEMTRKVLALNGKIKEVPITFIEREFGVSKMNLKIVCEAMLRVTLWGLRITK